MSQTQLAWPPLFGTDSNEILASSEALSFPQLYPIARSQPTTIETKPALPPAEIKHYDKVLFSDLWIRTKKRTLIRLTPNPVQTKFLDENFPDRRTDPIDLRGKREIILKARQQGFSTIVEALIFCDTINNPNTYSLVIGSKRQSTEAIFRMVKIFYNKLPPNKKRPTKYSSKRELYWEDINSSMYVGSAEVEDTGRGETINNLHLTEIPSWKNPEDLLSAVLEAVPDDDGFVCLESTAKGVGNFFHTTWLEAVKGTSNYHSTFSPWFEDPTNRAAVPADFERTEEEEALAALHNLDDGQLVWRRRKINDQKEKFPQEHPATPEEAFLLSGNPYFNRRTLQDRIDYLELNPATEFKTRPELSPRVAALRDGEFKVYKLPEPGRIYVIGADPSEGLNAKGSNHDYSPCDVFDAETWEQVATLHGRWVPREFGLLLAEIGTWYNTALLGIERNNHGHAVLNAVIYEAGYPAQTGTDGAGVYMHQEFDINKLPKDRRPGYPTTPKTKSMADDDLASAIDEAEIHLNSRETVGELMRYVKLPGGKAGGDGGSHDDRVRSVAIALQMLKLRPRGGWALDKKAREFLLNRSKGIKT